MFGGARLPETSTFLIYLGVSVCVLPVAYQWATAEPSRWGGAVVAVAAIGTAVAVLAAAGAVGGRRWLSPGRPARTRPGPPRPAPAGC